MPRAPRSATNGVVPRAVPTAAQGRFLPLDPRTKELSGVEGAGPTEEVVQDEVDPTMVMHASNPVDFGEAVPSSGLDGQQLIGLTGAAAGPVGQPDTIEAVGPNGELITLQRDQGGVFRTINTNVPPPPVSAEVDHPMLQQLRQRTNKPTGLVQRAPAYNHRMLWYMKPDGEIVPLQGDPGNRAYYEDKGYVVLRPDEERMYLRGDAARQFPPIRRMIIAEQRTRARLISVIRSIAKRNPSVELTGDLSITPTEELEAMLTQLRETQGINFRLIEGRQRNTPDYDERDDRVLEGIEAGSGHDLHRKMARSREQSQIGGVHRKPATGAVEMATSGQLMPGE